MKKLLPVMAIVCASGLAVAQSDKEPPKWTYVEAGFIDFSPDEGPSDDGWFAGGSVGLFKMFHIVAEYDDVGDFTFWNAGFGWHGLLGDPADVYAQAVWNDVEFDDDTNEVSDDGYEISAGVRWKFLKWLEAKGQVNWTDFDQGGDDVTANVGVLFTFLGDKLGAGADYELADTPGDSLRVFARWNFGR
jgi:hypothetical protein